MTKIDTLRQKVMDLWDDDDEVIEAVKEKMPIEEIERYERDEKSFQAESVIAYLGSMEDFYRLHCRGCGKDFVASYSKVTTCSIRCLRKVVEELGLTWNPEKSPEERWRPNTPHLTEPLRRPKESLTDFQGRKENYRRHLQLHHPVPLLVPSEALEMLDKMQEFQDDDAEPVPSSESS